MDINKAIFVSNWLRNFANTPNSLNMAIDHGAMTNVREMLLLLCNELNIENPVLSRNMQTARENLFVHNGVNPYSSLYYVNPFEAGIIIGLLDLIIGMGQCPYGDAWSNIHPSIVNVSKSLFNSGHYADAALDAFIEINARVKKLFHKLRPNDQVPDGVAVMNEVFSVKNPIIKLDDLSNETGRNIQLGYMQMLTGSMSALRNPKAHTNTVVISKEEAMRRLMFASMLMYKIDEGIRYSGIIE